MNRRNLLPGVTSAGVPPTVVCDARAAIARARRRAILRDALTLTLLLLVNYLFVRWPAAHVPSLDRDVSLLLVQLLNGVLLAHLWLARALPRWSARRIASTWCRNEQERFLRPLR